MHGPQSKVKVIEGTRDASGLRFSIVVGRFNSFITEQMLGAAVDTIVRSGGKAEDIEVVRAPGAFEIPMVCDEVCRRGGVDAVIALGCLMKGDTIHFDLIASEATKGVASVSLQHRIPVAFGIITTNTLEQAIDRAGAKMGNKGAEAADAAIEQARLYAVLRAGSKA
jgi:6,7-dimethyl-8-ribityllumazine synthase